jgi:hypothetical protein
MLRDHARRADDASADGVPDYDGKPESNAKDSKQPSSGQWDLRNCICGWLQEPSFESCEAGLSDFATLPIAEWVKQRHTTA